MAGSRPATPILATSVSRVTISGRRASLAVPRRTPRELTAILRAGLDPDPALVGGGRVGMYCGLVLRVGASAGEREGTETEQEGSTVGHGITAA